VIDARTSFKIRKLANPILFSAIALLIIALGLSFLCLQERGLRKQAGMEMQAVAALRAKELSEWHLARLADGRVFDRNTDFADTYRTLLSDPSNAAAKGRLLTWMSRFHEQYRYNRLLLFSPDGELMLCIPEGNIDDPALSALAAAPVGLDSVRFKDFYRNTSDSRIYLSILVPILEGINPGLLAMRMDPEQSLYPSLTRWPYLSSSPETLLVRIEGADVAYLNPLRFDPHAALRLRFNIAENPRLPAAQASSGNTMQFSGLDYRNVPVIAALSPVEASPWFVVTKIDLAEVEQNNQGTRIMVLALVLALLGMEAVGFLMLSKHWQIKVLALEAEEAARLADIEARNSQALNDINAKLEETVEHRTAELKTSNAELEAFAYSVAHDLRAPLRSIDGFSSILQEEYEPVLGEEGKRLLRIIRESNRTMDELISNLLEVSRVSRVELKMSMVDMRLLALKAFKQCAEAEAAADFEFALGELPMAMADDILMERVWVNLLSNAIKYSMRSPVHRIEIRGYLQDAMTVYVVKDHGAGFDQRYVDKLFGLFQRLHHSDGFKGSGIGLSIIKRIIERHGGTAWAEGQLGQGATFYFSLPRRE